MGFEFSIANNHPIPSPGQMAFVRQRRYLVEAVVQPFEDSEATLVNLSCIDDDAQGEALSVLWEHELDAQVSEESGWSSVAEKALDDPELFAAYLRTLSWNCITATDPDLFQALYLGIAALGRGPRVVFLRTTTTLMAAAKAAGELSNSSSNPNPADPYLTTVAYFNALRELGSARRIVEDEISSRLLTYSQRKRLNETQGVFSDRQISVEPVELTSRVGTAQVAEAKRRLALPAENKDSVDVALATNMISVGLDITRLGLMVVAGQPKTTSEYIQATSRVGRDASRPGLVVTLLNIHKPRDRSHYERYSNYHESFYRNVEATSVTPFSPRAMDRALPAVSVALSRLGILELTPSVAAAEVELHDKETREIAKAVGERAQRHTDGLPQDFGAYVTSRVQSLLDDWAMLARNAGDGGVTFGYSRRDRGVSTPLLREMIDPDRNTLNETQLRFRAPRSLRDVEPSVLLAVKTPEGNEIS